MEIIKDPSGRKMTIIRSFSASRELVWRAWTESGLLDQWWAPDPYRTITKTIDFRNGGHWHYAMVAPDTSEHYVFVAFRNIQPQKSFEATSSFCDENGILNREMPEMNWHNVFTSNGENTTVTIEITSDETAIRRIIEMGFEGGFTAALSNLDRYIAARHQLWNELRPTGTERVTTYLNFPGTTEEAFLFYRSVFRSEFSGRGIERFEDIPSDDGHPPVQENIKKMVLHVELPILGNHVLMATDAPPEMGFTLHSGNNMHICLEPATRTETQRLFEALSAGGKIDMPLEDMFFGSYFGSCTDRFGINWMFNCAEKAS